MIDSTYKDCVALYFEFYKKEEEGISPKFTDVDGANLKRIIKHLKTLGEGDAVANFNAILSNWHLLGKWYSDKYDINIILKQLNQIIRILKNGKTIRTSAGYQKAYNELKKSGLL